MLKWKIIAVISVVILISLFLAEHNGLINSESYRKVETEYSYFDGFDCDWLLALGAAKNNLHCGLTPDPEVCQENVRKRVKDCLQEKDLQVSDEEADKVIFRFADTFCDWLTEQINNENMDEETKQGAKEIYQDECIR